MALADLFEGKFRADIRHVGEAYVRGERVAITRVLPNQVLAVVRDGTDYETRLVRDDTGLKMFCQCERFQKTGTCKHVWATIVAVDEAGHLTATPKAGYVPPFASDTTEIDWTNDDWDEDVPQEALPKRRRRTQTDAPKVELRPWERTLLDVRSKMETGGNTSADERRDEEVFFEIDVAASRQVGRLVVQTSFRQRRASGQWGKLKPLRLRPDELDELTHEDDRRILAYLTGGTPERTNWTAQQTETQTKAFRYHVAFELCELIVPLMCSTGRVRILDEDTPGGEPLSWDDGAPWELTLHVEPTVANGWQLDGTLVRDGERLRAHDTTLVVPGGLVVSHNRVSRLLDFGAFDWFGILDRDEPLEVPEEDAVDLVDRLFDMPRLPRLELPDELQLEEITAEPTPRLLIHTPKAKRWNNERLHADVEFEYLGVRVAGANSQWAIVRRDERRCIVRDRQREAAAWEMLRSLGFRRRLDRRAGEHDVDFPARELGSAVLKLVEVGWDVQADDTPVRQAGELQFRVQTGIDWFELRGDVNFGGASVAFPELLAALARGDGTIRLDDGSLGILPAEWMERFGLLAGLGTPDEEGVRFGRNQVALLDALLATESAVDYDERFLELRDRFRDFDGFDEVTEPGGFDGELRPYQREGLGWLQFLEEFDLGGCLADDMGLGKTIQVLALLLARRRRESAKLPPALVVVPKSLLFNWRREAERFTPELKVLDYTGLERAGLRDQFDRQDVILTTYGTLRRDASVLRERAFDYVVLDEAQTIKNAGSQVAKASRLLRCQHRLALSGTPIENHLGDLWSIFEFLNPGMLGRSSAFKLYAADQEDESSREVLAKGLQPFILRRTKQQVASELPDKSEQTIFCEMGEKQRKLYDELREHYRASLLGLIGERGLAKSKMHVLEALLRLRQAACHPGLLDNAGADAESAKLDVLCPQLEELVAENHKALVFSQFTSMLALVRKQLDERGIVYEYLDGQTQDRQSRVERFQDDPDCGVFLISLKAGGLGLNLTAADYVFLLDPWWNPAVEAQAIDRAHRVGQTRHVFAYRLIVRDTVEEKIAELQQRKRDLADAILTANGSMLKDMTSDDLELLLS